VKDAERADHGADRGNDQEAEDQLDGDTKLLEPLHFVHPAKAVDFRPL
jgi:hypothetical protein